MTETELLRSLKEDFRSVTTSVNNFGREISAMSSTLDGVSRDVRDHAEKILEIRELELTCPARAREITGAVELKSQRSSTSPLSSNPPAVALLVKLAPWLLFAGVAVGSLLSANGEAKASAQAIKDLAATVAEVQRAVGAVGEVQ